MRLIRKCGLYTCLFSCVLLITSCKSTPTQDTPLTLSPDQQQQAVEDRAKMLLEQAEMTEAEEKIQLMLQAAQLLAQNGDTPWARSIIASLPSIADAESPLTVELQVRKRLIQSYISAAEGYYPLAYDRLNKEFIDDSMAQLPTDLVRSIYRLRAQLLYDMGFYTASAEQRVLLSNQLTSGAEESVENDTLIWQTLMEIPLKQLEKLAKKEPERELKGWYELAVLSKDNQTNLQQQLEALDSWMLLWPDHPASLSLPGDLQLLRQLVETQPQQVAVLLPFTGKLSGAANAIRDGFLAAFYDRQTQQALVPSLHFYDTQSADINTLYDQAVQEGAQLVIGPLSKDLILEISMRPSMPVPTLALNTIDNPMAATENLYQFGLGVEDEATIAADKAWRDGHRRALIIAPNNAWGDRSVQAFAQQWQLLGGDLASDYRFEDTNDYVKVIQKALQLDQSNQRARDLRGIVGKIEFEPRRRQDIDVIFLAAQAQQARQVKPTLAFHYAGSIPVYGTSQVYSGEPNRKLDQDMNGVKFSTLPWTFNDESPIKQSIRKHTENSANLQPLYALGVDCFHLYPRLKQLENVDQAQFYGQTGKLKLNESRQIIRQQIWAEFQKGRVRPLAEAR